MNRSCGECSECCDVFSVKELQKPSHTPCSFKSEIGGGCNIYENRPKACQKFKCGWLNGFGESDDRPDKCGFILMRSPTHKHLPIIQAYECKQGGFGGYKFHALTKAIVDTGMAIICVGLDGTREVVGHPEATKLLLDEINSKIEPTDN